MVKSSGHSTEINGVPKQEKCSKKMDLGNSAKFQLFEGWEERVRGNMWASLLAFWESIFSRILEVEIILREASWMYEELEAVENLLFLKINDPPRKETEDWLMVSTGAESLLIDEKGETIKTAGLIYGR